MKSKGLIFVVSAPSGAGKTTLCKTLLETLRNIYFSVSVTTRRPRGDEVNGRDYFFITEEEFRKKIKCKELIEWAKVHNHCYGTPKKFVNESLSGNRDVVLDIDVQGGVHVKKIYSKAILIFITPPSFGVLEKRLVSRGVNNKLEIEKRLHNARKEMRLMNEYDYVVVNDKISEAVRDIKSIVNNERKKK